MQAGFSARQNESDFVQEGKAGSLGLGHGVGNRLPDIGVAVPLKPDAVFEADAARLDLDGQESFPRMEYEKVGFALSLMLGVSEPAKRVEDVILLGQVAQGEDRLRFAGAAVVILGSPWDDGGHGV